MSTLLKGLKVNIIAETYDRMAESLKNLDSPRRKELSKKCHEHLSKITVEELGTLTKNARIATCLAIEHEIKRISELHSMISRCYKKETFNDKFPDWEFAKDSSHIKKTFGYYGQLWVNHKTKQIVIVNSGTKLEFASYKDSGLLNLFGVMHLAKDIVNDLQIKTKKMPFQYKSGAEKFTKEILEGPEYKEYDLVFTGHSLGAILADGGALYAEPYKEKYKSITSVTMENPGSEYFMRMLVKNLKKHAHLPEDFDLESIRDGFEVINNTPNWVNTAGKHFGDVYLNESEISSEPQDICHKLVFPFIKNIVRKMQEHYDAHDKDAFAKVHRISYIDKTEWPIGMFDSDIAGIYHKIKSVLGELPHHITENIIIPIASMLPYSFTSNISSAITTASCYAHDTVDYVSDVFDEMFSEDYLLEQIALLCGSPSKTSFEL